MPRFQLFQLPRETAESLTFEDVVSVTKGLVVSSAAAASDESMGEDFLELGLSRTYNLRMTAVKNRLVVTLVPTLNKDEFPPVRLPIIQTDEPVTAALLEKRIYHLRQVYAVALLVDADRSGELGSLLEEDPDADIEQQLVSAEQKLVISEAASGSLIVSLLAKTKQAYQAILYACAVPYATGRDALLGRVRANTALAELEVEAKKQELVFKNAHGLIDVAKKLEKLKDHNARTAIEQRLLRDMGMLMPSGHGPADLAAIEHQPTLDIPLNSSRRAGSEVPAQSKQQPAKRRPPTLKDRPQP